jgi:glutathione-independent formaldehyde dehydrogenase
MANIRGVAYMGPSVVEIQNIDFPKLIGPGGRKCDYGVISKVVATNICNIDQRLISGRTRKNL